MSHSNVPKETWMIVVEKVDAVVVMMLPASSFLLLHHPIPHMLPGASCAVDVAVAHMAVQFLDLLQFGWHVG